MLFFLLPYVTLILIVVFGVLMGWRMWRQHAVPPLGGGARRLAKDRPLPLVPAVLLRGADRTWVVFTGPGSALAGEVRQIERRLGAREPHSQITVVDASREPRLAEVFGIELVPTALLANRYGQVEARLVGLRAIQEFTEARA
jgi:hypothetical protein